MYARHRAPVSSGSAGLGHQAPAYAEGGLSPLYPGLDPVAPWADAAHPASPAAPSWGAPGAMWSPTATLPPTRPLSIAVRRRRTRRWPWTVALVLGAFAGGIAARPRLEREWVVVAAKLPQLPRALRPTPSAAAPVPATAPAPVAAPVASAPQRPNIVPLTASVTPAAPVAVASAVPPAVESPAPERPVPTRAVQRTPVRRAAPAPRKTTVARAVPREPARKPAPAVSPAAAEPEPATQPSDPLERLMVAAVSKKPRANSKIDELTSKVGAASSEDEEARPAAEDASAAPLTYAQIRDVMKGLQPDVEACARRFKKTGTASLKITVDGDGDVKKVTVAGPLAQTPTAHCIEQAVLVAEFPASRGLTFSYPLAFR